MKHQHGKNDIQGRTQESGSFWEPKKVYVSSQSRTEQAHESVGRNILGKNRELGDVWGVETRVWDKGGFLKDLI